MPVVELPMPYDITIVQGATFTLRPAEGPASAASLEVSERT